jgi:hypothetical protein
MAGCSRRARVLAVLLVVGAALVPALVSGQTSENRWSPPSQRELHDPLDAVSAAARDEADREAARRLAPFDLWWAVR